MKVGREPLRDRAGDAAANLPAVDLDELRATLTEYLDEELANLVVESDDDAKPTAGFQRVIQRAVIHTRPRVTSMRQFGAHEWLMRRATLRRVRPSRSWRRVRLKT